jgi:hypothetical protein
MNVILLSVYTVQHIIGEIKKLDLRSCQFNQSNYESFSCLSDFLTKNTAFRQSKMLHK